MARFAVAFHVVYIITSDDVDRPQTPFPVLNSLALEPEPLLLSFSFYKCNITTMCNINFDADREITMGIEREGQRRRILFRGGSDFIFFCLVILIL